MNFPKVLKSVWTMDDADVNKVGEHLGYGWNVVCEAVREEEFYGMDGSGSFTVARGDEIENKILAHIMQAIFKAYPNVDEIQIINS